MTDEVIVPNMAWAQEQGRIANKPTRCPFATVARCPRYYQTLALMGENGSTSIPIEADADLLVLWKASDLWPLAREQATAVSGSLDGPRSYTNLCPELAYGRFGYFAQDLFPFHDEIDQDRAIEYWSKRPVAGDHWGYHWSGVTPLHYLQCQLYSPLTARNTSMDQTVPRALSPLIRKIAVVCKDHTVLREIDDLFILAGAEAGWWAEPNITESSERMRRVYGWVQGTILHAPDLLEEVVSGVAVQLADRQDLSDADAAFLRRGGGGTKLSGSKPAVADPHAGLMPNTIEALLTRLIGGLPRAMIPLKHRRQAAATLGFDDEYDVQSLIHSQLAPWVKDIRPEEYTPSYAGKSSRLDFLLKEHRLVIEAKYIRDRKHGRSVGDELIIDIARYKVHPDCDTLWIVIYDPNGYITNAEGMRGDLEHEHMDGRGQLCVRMFILQP